MKLTAYLMGELDAAEAQELERALEGSAELRAQRAQLESVIGLVVEHGAEQETLSEDAHAAIASSAGGGAVHSLSDARQYSPLVNAASVLLLVGAAGALYVMNEESADTESMELARAEGEAALEDRLKDNVTLEEVVPDREQGLAQVERQTEAAPALGLQSNAATVGAPAVQAPQSGGGAAAAGPGTPGPAGPSSPSPFTGQNLNNVIGLGGGAGGKYGSRSGGRSKPKSEASRGVHLYFAGGGLLPESSTRTGAEDFFLGQSTQAEWFAADPVLFDSFTGEEGDVTGQALIELDEGVVIQDSEAEARKLQLRHAERFSTGLIDSCKALPDEKPSAMFYRFWGDNPFVQTSLDSQSTFGVDVDTASYTLARRYLADGKLPEKAQIRTEEFLNYFKPDVDAPTDGVFRVHTELAPSRFGGTDGKYMLRVTVRGKDVAREERQPLNLTFVVDVSGSMNQGNRLETVKHGLRLLTAQLDANDSIALVAYSNEARIVLPMTSAGSRALIEEAIHGLAPGGGTNAEAGLKMGYAAAADQVSDGRHHRVVLLSDGVANIGQTDQDRINADIQKYRDRGIYLNTIGVGMENHNDAFLEQLANKGDGICNYIDDEKEARRALVENFTGAFEPIARDVKIQVEFESGIVKRYRQIGYENRAIADADFRNDAVDAGEVGAGHQVTALYELELEPGAELVKGALAQVRLRWKEPTGADRDPAEDSATEREWATTLNSAVSLEGASYGFRRALCVAQFAELLRRSQHAREDSLDELIAAAERLEREHLAGTPGADDDFVEFIAMMKRGKEVILAAMNRARTPLEDCVHELRDRRWRHHSCLKVPGESAEVQALEVEIAALEAKVRELVQDELR
ncbi:MAG: von Willebrand factor type A domain-containing protein [Planctomycetes bacterium]|nr:von Willebrand factor type A domain-containing protein [Planctomycetota bacterium]